MEMIVVLNFGFDNVKNLLIYVASQNQTKGKTQIRKNNFTSGAELFNIHM